MIGQVPDLWDHLQTLSRNFRNGTYHDSALRSWGMPTEVNDTTGITEWESRE